MDDDDDEETDDDELFGETAWISWYCSLRGHEALAEIEEDFIRDNFNLYGLRPRFAHYDLALDKLLSLAPDVEALEDLDFLPVHQEAFDLYALIHARYICSPFGLSVMREKYLAGHFGVCPRVYCDLQHVLPLGASEELRSAPLRVYCPKCEQCYVQRSKHKELDGAHFGPSFPQIFLQAYPALVPTEVPKAFVPRLFGFKVHKQHSIITLKLESDQAQRPNVGSTGTGGSGGGGGESANTQSKNEDGTPAPEGGKAPSAGGSTAAPA